MMHEGKIILDIKGEQREKMTVAGLIDMFRDASGEQVQSDRIIGEVSKGGARRMRKRCR